MMAFKFGLSKGNENFQSLWNKKKNNGAFFKFLEAWIATKFTVTTSNEHKYVSIESSVIRKTHRSSSMSASWILLDSYFGVLIL